MAEDRYTLRGVTPLHMIHKWSIEHPYAVLSFWFSVVVLAILVVVTGYLPRRIMPYVESPMLAIVTMMPGLSAQEMELYISKPIEEQMVNVKDLHYIRSTSQDGLSIVTLEFYYGTDMKRAYAEVQSLLNVVQANLPQTGANLKPSWIVPIDPLNLPILTFGLTGDPAKGWDWVRLRQFADNEVVNRLKMEPGVYSVYTFGGYKRQLQIDLDKDRLAVYGLSVLDVVDAINSYSVAQSIGRLTFDDREVIIRVDYLARPDQLDQILSIPLAARSPAPPSTSFAFRQMGSEPIVKDSEGMSPTGSMGSMTGNSPIASSFLQDRQVMGSQSVLPSPSAAKRIIYLRDVAIVKDSYWEKRSGYYYVKREKDGAALIRPAIEVAVIQEPGGSSAQLTPRILAAIKDLEKRYDGVRFEVTYDNSRFVNKLFENIWHELGLAVLFTGVVIILFLGEWRGALISLISIPTSLAFAILCLVPAGFSLNTGTLVGLLLSIGRLVDDTIIDIHAVERYLRRGYDPRTATIEGIAEVRLAVLASTATFTLALVPLLFCGGITQLMYVELVYPLLFALGASMLVSFTLTPILTANWLRRQEERQWERRHFLLRLVYLPLDPFQKFLDRVETGYEKAIDWTLRNRFGNLSRITATIIIGFGFYYFVGGEMMPLGDVGQAFGTLEMQPGSSFQDTDRAARQLTQIIAKYPELEVASIEVGAETMLESWSPYFTGYQMPQVTGAAFMLTFKEKEKRQRSIWDLIDSIQRDALNSIPGLRRIQIKEMGVDVMATAAAPIHLIIAGPDFSVLHQLGQQLLKLCETDPLLKEHFYQPALTWTMNNEAYELVLDLPKMRELGLTPSDLAQQTYYALTGGLANEFYRLPSVRQSTIRIRLQEEDRRHLKDLSNLFVKTADGRTIPLNHIAEVRRRPIPTAIERDGLRRVIGLTGYYRPGKMPSMDLAMEIEARAFQNLNFPPGYTMEMRGDMTQMMDSFRRLLISLGLAFVFMYLILVAQFRSFLMPIQMVASLPLELSGVFFGLWLMKMTFSSVSIMAVIVLSGMDITTAILLIDMIMRYREQGIPRDEAIKKACPQRLRPILMTSCTTMAALVPLAFFPGMGMEAYQSLGVVVIFGLIIGTILSLFDIPIMHTYADDLVQIVNRGLSRIGLSRTAARNI
ncbi:MAG: efflux RND transporter permease subunit [Armatimonadetes bacterium]|nr:efflux RND transporter permease subunit [Armatimonadota bacterium]MDW8121022.1 efflux RND transporter permease subunit [Armatimonadota bacterium]